MATAITILANFPFCDQLTLFWYNIYLKCCVTGDGEMTQLLRALPAIAEDSGSVLSTHVVAHNRLLLQF